MLEWLEQIPYWLNQVLQGADYVIQRVDVLAIPLGILYVLGNRRARHQLLKVRCADALLIELYSVHKMLKEIVDNAIEIGITSQMFGPYGNRQGEFGYLFQRNVYDGLVSSSNITYFDHGMQKKLHGLYGDVKLFGWNISKVAHGDVSGWSVEANEAWVKNMPHRMDETIRAVKAFRNRNRYRGRWLRLLKALGLEYED